MTKKERPMKHLQVSADVHEAVNMMKQRYGVDKLHTAIEEFIKDRDPDLLETARRVVDMRLGLADTPVASDSTDNQRTQKRNVRSKP